MTGFISSAKSVSAARTATPAMTLRSFSRLPASVTRKAPTNSTMMASTGKCI